MSTLAAVLLGVLALALLQLRPAGPDARTWGELAAARRAAGWGRTAARTVQVTAVTVLLLLAVGCRLLWHAAYGIGTVLAAIALGLAAFGAGPELAGGHA
jgi:hypothetical protein